MQIIILLKPTKVPSLKIGQRLILKYTAHYKLRHEQQILYKITFGSVSQYAKFKTRHNSLKAQRNSDCTASIQFHITDDRSPFQTTMKIDGIQNFRSIFYN